MKEINKKSLSLIILDRDGVINQESKNYIKSPQDFNIIKSSIEAINIINKKKIPIAIATNQSGIGRNIFTYDTVCQIHKKMITIINNKSAIKYIAICPHNPDQNCNCRKPKIGLLSKISKKLNIALDKRVYFVGDSNKDIEAAQNAGCTAVLVKTGRSHTINKKYKKYLTFKNLKKFAISII